jgi:hypothetical protein
MWYAFWIASPSAFWSLYLAPLKTTAFVQLGGW